MLSSKSKILSGFVLACLIFILTQIPIASAQSADSSPGGSASLWTFGGDALAFFNFPNSGDKSAANGNAANSAAATKIWDGGGATGNWSDAANWSDDIVPASDDTVIFDGTSTKNATIDTNITVGAIQINGGYTGTISQSAANVTLNGAGGAAFTQAAGTFGNGSGAIVFNGNFTQTGGTFNATTGTATFNGGVFTRGAGAIFNHNNGTVVFTGNQMQVIIVSGATATQDFGNLTIATPGGLFGSENDTLRVNGTLNLNNGVILSIIVEALGAVNVANTFGNGTENPGEGKILFSGSTTRVVTLPVLTGAYNNIELNAPNTTVNLSGAGEAKLAQLDLISGTFNAGTTSVRFHRVGNGASTQSGGVFDCGSGVMTFNFGGFTQTGGSFNCQNATIDSTTVTGLQFHLIGGTFNAPTGTMTFNGGIFERGANGTFNHDNGSVIFAGDHVGIIIVDGSTTTTQDFGNLMVNTPGGLSDFDNDTLRVNGNLSLSGQASSVSFAALGNVDVPSGFTTNTSTSITFTGSRNQTFTNGGGANASGNWTIDKPSGTVTAATSLILGTNQPLNITSGTLYLNNNSNLTTGALNIGAGGRLINESATTITLGGNLTNGGTVDLQGGGAGCPEADSIFIRSSNGAQRAWTGGGNFRLVDVDVQNMGGAGTTKIVYSGTDGGGNDASWIFNPGCSLAISGRLTGNSQPLAYTTVNLTGSAARAGLTNSNGEYVFGDLQQGGNYVVTPAKPNYTFTPPNRAYNNFSSSQTNQDFVGGTDAFRVGGRVSSVSNASIFALSGITITLGGATTQTDVNGNYVFNGVALGNYTVAASRLGYSFTPSSVQLNVDGDKTVDFTAQSDGTLSGRVIYESYGFINVMNAEGSGDTNFTCIAAGTDGCYSDLPSALITNSAEFSPDGSKVVGVKLYPVSQFASRHRIRTMNFDGSNVVELQNSPVADSVYEDDPTWSPDGTKIAFIQSAAASSLIIANSDGTNRTTIYTFAGGVQGIREPDWSPDGTRIVFATRNGAVFVVNSNGANLTRLTPNAGFDIKPKWSPDGSKIAFIRSGRIFTMNPDGTNQTQISSGSLSTSNSAVAWSPDGSKLAFANVGAIPNKYGVMSADGSVVSILRSSINPIENLSWSPNFSVSTNTGSNATTVAGSVSVTFGSVGAAGATSIVPITPHGAGTVPNPFYLGNYGAFEISTTAQITPPVTICIAVAAMIPEITFNSLSLLHNEGGVLVDRTTSRDYPTRRICAATNSLSPFAVAEQIDPNLPRIAGLVRDSNGNPLINTTVNLGGAGSRTTTTDSGGLFSFVNLTAGAGYNVQPKQIGCLFAEYNHNFVNLTGEQTVVFTGTAADFQISGRITDGGGNGVNGAAVELGGASQAATSTDAGGNYTFTNLPADGFYTISPFKTGSVFSPATAVVDPLTSDAAGVDFQTFAPTAAAVSIGGRVWTANGRGLARARVTLTDAGGAARIVQTDSSGYYRFQGVAAGETYVIAVKRKLYSFSGGGTLVLSGNEENENIDFTALPQAGAEETGRRQN